MSQWISGITDAQKDLISALRRWSGVWEGQAIGRKVFDPGVVCRHLANLSVVEWSAGHQLYFRFVGSSLSGNFGQGRRLEWVSDLPDETAQLWQKPAQSLLQDRRMLCGVESNRRCDRSHAWLRIPLVDESGRLVQMLCHDTVEVISDATPTRPISNDVHGHEITLAA